MQLAVMAQLSTLLKLARRGDANVRHSRRPLISADCRAGLLADAQRGFGCAVQVRNATLALLSRVVVNAKLIESIVDAGLVDVLVRAHTHARARVHTQSLTHTSHPVRRQKKTQLKTITPLPGRLKQNTVHYIISPLCHPLRR